MWAVVKETCDITNIADPFLEHTVTAIRDAYGEQEIRELAENAPLIVPPDPADSVANKFAVDHLMAAFRSSLPDPAAEGGKPAQMTNYRSETAELVARSALATVYQMATPPTLHATKGNRNQPILGFDGWSIMQMGTELALVLIQVKGSEDKSRPPGVAGELIVECGRAVIANTKLQGFLIACVLRCKDTEYSAPLMNMIIELTTNGKIANTILAPVIIRGAVEANEDDLTTLRAATPSFLHAKARGMSLSIGTELTEFGRTAMTRARQNG
ncbi:hypothetical protein AB8B02_19050 [Tardiphaga sp. 862_B3_N4_1]|uniref:hypothetical protein n=1 Tax=Tardiphaga sp. 862_B3_N4_1 TaxID=3240764 RepID=UPI003F2582D8